MVRISQYLRALALDPLYASAWVRMARIYIRFAGSADLSDTESESKARDALQRALAIDPNLAAAYRWTGREFERAIALDPNGQEGGWAREELMGMVALTTGQFEEVLLPAAAVVAHDPLDVNSLRFDAWMLSFSGQPAEAASPKRRTRATRKPGCRRWRSSVGPHIAARRLMLSRSPRCMRIEAKSSPQSCGWSTRTLSTTVA
jgi:hypothetical protein